MHTERDLQLLWWEVMQEIKEDIPVYYNMLREAGYKACVRNKVNNSFGWCNYRDKIVVVNWHLHKNSTRDMIVDTMKHEIAHAIDGCMGKFSRHGAHWQKLAAELGANPKATSKEPLNHEYKYVLVLVDRFATRCVRGYNRKPNRMYPGKQPNMWLKSDKEGTEGKLWLYKWDDWVKVAKEYGVSPYIRDAEEENEE